MQNLWSLRVKLFLQRLLQPTFACMSCMPGSLGNIWSLLHWTIALRTGVVTGLLAVLLSFTPAAKLFQNRYKVDHGRPHIRIKDAAVCANECKTQSCTFVCPATIVVTYAPIVSSPPSVPVANVMTKSVTTVIVPDTLLLAVPVIVTTSPTRKPSLSQLPRLRVIVSGPPPFSAKSSVGSLVIETPAIGPSLSRSSPAAGNVSTLAATVTTP